MILICSNNHNYVLTGDKTMSNIKESIEPFYSTDYGKYYIGKCEEVINSLNLLGKVQLILTSPPFPLNKKKKYGNLSGTDYLEWFGKLAPLFSKLLTPNGSIVIEMGNAWEPNRPVQSLLTFNSLLKFVNYPKAKKILIEVKYREEAPIADDDAISSLCEDAAAAIIVTKSSSDFGVHNTKSGKDMIRIPAFAFLYLLGHAEKHGYKGIT